jgi:hypothetical protein
MNGKSAWTTTAVALVLFSIIAGVSFEFSKSRDQQKQNDQRLLQQQIAEYESLSPTPGATLKLSEFVGKRIEVQGITQWCPGGFVFLSNETSHPIFLAGRFASGSTGELRLSGILKFDPPVKRNKQVIGGYYCVNDPTILQLNSDTERKH